MNLREKTHLIAIGVISAKYFTTECSIENLDRAYIAIPTQVYDQSLWISQLQFMQLICFMSNITYQELTTLFVNN